MSKILRGNFAKSTKNSGNEPGSSAEIVFLPAYKKRFKEKAPNSSYEFLQTELNALRPSRRVKGFVDEEREEKEMKKDTVVFEPNLSNSTLPNSIKNAWLEAYRLSVKSGQVAVSLYDKGYEPRREHKRVTLNSIVSLVGQVKKKILPDKDFRAWPVDVSTRGLGFLSDRRVDAGEVITICLGYRHVHLKVKHVIVVQSEGEAFFRVGAYSEDEFLDLKSLFWIHQLFD